MSLGSIDMDVLIDIITITDPFTVLDIGFHHGASAELCLSRGCRVTSIDLLYPISDITRLRSKYPNQFRFRQTNSNNLGDYEWVGEFDLAIIDGDHDSPWVEFDAMKCVELKCKYLVFDDSNHLSHPNVRTLINNGVDRKLWTVIKDYDIGCGTTLVKVL